MIQIRDFIQDFPLETHADKPPWDIVTILPHLLHNIIEKLDEQFLVSEGVAIHKSATVEHGVVLKAPIIICAGSFIGAHAYLRGGVYIGKAVVIGPDCEIKTSVIGAHSCVAHFNFIGDSIVGSHVNFEAGAITANHHNDRSDKRIFVVHNGAIIDTGVDKFGSLVGDHSKIGANAVLSPGSLLSKNMIVKRLQLIDQNNR